MPIISQEVKLFIKFQRKYNKFGSRKIQQEIWKEYNIHHSVSANTNLIKKIDENNKVDNFMKQI